MTPDSLADSFSEEAPDATFTSCSKQSERRWTCDTTNEKYQVVSEDDGCWSAIRKVPNDGFDWKSPDGEPEAETYSACVKEE